MPLFHSYSKPSKIIIIIIVIVIGKIIFFLKIKGKGRIKIISISKIKKIIAIIKNFKENDIREIENGSNPHSNGDNFSLSINLFLDKIIEIIIITDRKSVV